MSTLALILVVFIACCIAAGIIFLSPFPRSHEKTATQSSYGRIFLPAPKISGTVSVEEAVSGRRSVRVYEPSPLDISEISQILWAAQGQTDPSGLRTAPSAGALYPLEIYVASGNITRLPGGVYHYLPASHALEQVNGRDVRQELYHSALRQPSVRDAAAVIIIAADYNRTIRKYGERGIRYAHLEAGHVSENIYLQAYTIGIGTVAIGAFDDNSVRSVLGLPQNQTPMYLMPIGKMKKES